MVAKRVAGTIILHTKEKSSRFLVQVTEDTVGFALTEVSQDHTGLASFLNYLKQHLQLDVNDIRLIELTNAQIRNESIPLFVFEATYDHMPVIPEDFAWEEPEKIREVLTEYQLEGVPLF